jgi:hypothetical protein
MDTEVIITQINISTNAMTPGTKLVAPFNSGSPSIVVGKSL